MGRSHNQIVTFADLKWMEDNGFLYTEIPTVPNNRCVPAGTLRLKYNLDETLLTNYIDTRLVPYQRIKQNVRFKEDIVNIPYTSNNFTLEVFNSKGTAWTISVVYMRWYPLPVNDWREDVNANYLSINPTTGTDTNKIINFSAGYNDTPYNRRMDITIKENGTNNAYTITVTQRENPGVDTSTVTLATGSDAENACGHYASDLERGTYYVPQGQSWYGASKLFSNPEGTTLANSGWYSNGDWSRNWNKGTEAFYGNTQCEDPVDPDPDPPVPDNKLIQLVTASDAPTTCALWANTGARQNYYIPEDRNFTGGSNTGVLYADLEGTTLAPTGWYSNGVSARLWIRESSSFIDAQSC